MKGTETELPLGTLAGVDYAESVVEGDHFTFVSDGVIEAENAKRELFGSTAPAKSAPRPRKR